MLQRAKRFLSTLSWLLLLHLRTRPDRFLLTSGLNVCAHLGSIIGFVVAIKAISVVTAGSLEHTVQYLKPYIDVSLEAAKFAIVCAPLAVFGFAAVCQRYGAYLSSTMIFDMVRTIIDTLGEQAVVNSGAASGQTLGGFQEDIFEMEIVAGSSDPTGVMPEVPVEEEVVPAATAKEARRQAEQHAQLFSAGYRRLHRIEQSFLTLCETLVVAFLATALGLVINFKIMAIVMVLGTVFLGSFVLVRQRSAHDLAEEMRRLAAEEALLRKSAGNQAGTANARPSVTRAQLAQIGDLVHRAWSLNYIFQSRARYISLLTQGAMIVGLVVYAGYNLTTDPYEIAHLGIMFMIVRFTLSALQKLGHTAIALGRDYPYLIKAIGEMDARKKTEAA